MRQPRREKIESLIPAPYPSDARAGDHPFRFDYRGFKYSDDWHRARTGPRRATMLLAFAESWTQTPCGSLPFGNADLSSLLGVADVSFLEKCGWWLASDGRMYHQKMVGMVEDMLASRRKSDHRQHRDVVLMEHGCVCKYCDRALDEVTLDHVIPRSLGGSSEPCNLVPACRSCNSSKGARTPEQWRSAR